MQKKVLILGSTGFIGSHISLHLQKYHSNTYEVLNFDRAKHGSLLENNLLHNFILDSSPNIVINCAWLDTSKVGYRENPVNLDWAKTVYELHKVCYELNIFAVSIGTESEKNKLAQDVYVDSKRSLHGRLSRAGLLNNSCWLQPSYILSLEDLRPNLISSISKDGSTPENSIKNPFAKNDYIHVLDVISAIMYVISNKISGSFSAISGFRIQNLKLALAVVSTPHKFLIRDSCAIFSSEHSSWTPKYTRKLIRDCGFQE